MKFISKQANYRVVLKHGQPSEPITGRNAVPGVYIKFENGIANVDDKELSEMMLKHPGFNSDFIVAEEETKDPWADSRKSTEPDHAITEIKYGHVGKSTGTPANKLTKEQQKMVKEMAQEVATQIAPKMAMDMLKKLMEDKENKEEIKEEKEDIPEEPVKKTTAKKTKINK